jgi:hypothetical protein
MLCSPMRNGLQNESKDPSYCKIAGSMNWSITATTVTIGFESRLFKLLQACPKLQKPANSHFPLPSSIRSLLQLAEQLGGRLKFRFRGVAIPCEVSFTPPHLLPENLPSAPDITLAPSNDKSPAVRDPFPMTTQKNHPLLDFRQVLSNLSSMRSLQRDRLIS